MTAVAMVIAGLLMLGFDAADFTITGLSLLGALLIAIGLWVGGAFTRAAWIADAETSARLDLVDQDLDRMYGRQR